MPKICSILFCLFLIGTTNVYAQDKFAKTSDGQTVVLKKDGTWRVLNNTATHDNKAMTDNGELVLLGSDGKWFPTNVFAAPPSWSQGSNQSVEKEYSSSSGTFTIPYSSETASGTAFVHVPASGKNDLLKPRPLMLLLDPGGNAPGIVARWQHAADRFGWIVASTPVIKNGNNTDQDLLHLLALLDAVAANWPVDKNAIILGGMSGGGCGAYRHALERPDLFRGAIVECGHMGPFQDLQDRIRPGSFFFLATRDQDFNSPAMHTLAEALQERGETVKLIELTGGHEPLTGADADDALEWMNSMIK
jgi:predicted esterase